MLFFMRSFLFTGMLSASLFLWESRAFAQANSLEATQTRSSHSQMDSMDMDHSQMRDMNHSSMPGMTMPDMNTAESFLMNFATGTSANPAAWPMPMIMKNLGSWNTMFMGQAFLIDTQQSGPRGGDKFYSSNWVMANFQHKLGKTGAIQFQTMFSLEPATITQRRYPLLFQTGESAFGKPIVDGQHPHDLFMGLGIQYARSLGEHSVLEISFSPVGDPALGPVAYPHRASAMELPQATLSHHWQDSTHIANEVLTAGIAYKKIKIEASGFYGQEPNENRWNIDSGPMNSWSTRLWFFPTPNWAAQVSVGRLAQPEALHPGDVLRSTASLTYSKPLRGGSWSSSFIWGRNHSVGTQRNTDAYVLESVIPVHRRNFITGRLESVDKDELFSNNPELEERFSHSTGSGFRIGAYTLGYTRDIPFFQHVQSGIGANVEFYTLPDAIRPYYGNHPVGGNIFIRFRLRSPE